MTVTMSRRCYETAVLPGVEMRDVPAPDRQVRRGKGVQVQWDTSAVLPVLRERVIDYLDCSVGWDDEGAAADRRVLREWLARNPPEANQVEVPWAKYDLDPFYGGGRP